MVRTKTNTLTWIGAGVNEVSLDAEKGMLTVVGNVDPVCVASSLRKAGYYAEITSVGPPKKPDEKQKSPEKPKPLPACCKQCQLVGVVVDYGGGGCSIL